jgi:hypothetical protein
MAQSDPFEKDSKLTIPTDDVNRLHTTTLDLLKSIVFDKEQFLMDFIEKSGLSEAEFIRDWVLEEEPIELLMSDFGSFNEYSIKATQKFRLRPKTEDEKQLEIETNKERNVDPNNA